MTIFAPQATTPRISLSPDQAAIMDLVGHEPFPEQIPILACMKRFMEVAGGEQGGKSYTAADKWLLQYTEDLNRHPGFGDGDNEPLLYWLVAADYNRTRREFDYITTNLMKLGLPVVATKRVDPGYIEVQFPDELRPRVWIETKSAKDPRTLAMYAPHGIIICEASQVDLETYNKCNARIAPRRGWLFMSGTFEGSLGWYPGLYNAWLHGTEDSQSFSLPSWTNKALYPGGREDPEIHRLERESSDEFFLERIAGIPCPPKGVVFHEFRPDIHIRDVEWLPEYPVHIWTDPGYGDACAVEAVQVVEGQVRVFDEIYERGLVTQDIIQVCQNRPWWGSDGQVNVKFGVADVYARQHQAQPAVMEVWEKETGIRFTSQKVPINEGTERLKGYLKPDPLSGVPKIIFSPKCRGILSEFGAVSNPFDGQTKVYKWKTDREGNIIGDTPKDEFNHGVKAVIYGLVDNFGYAQGTTRQVVKVKRWR